MAYRPSHADATYDAKYGLRAIAGGGAYSCIVYVCLEHPRVHVPSDEQPLTRYQSFATTPTQNKNTGRSSARETIGRVAAAAIAKKVLKLYSGVEIIGYVKKVRV